MGGESPSFAIEPKPTRKLSIPVRRLLSFLPSFFLSFAEFLFAFLLAYLTGCPGSGHAQGSQERRD